ncbi:MATE family efflux transporter [Anaerosacchariphilus polymeriproducens]|uniref:Probable multidrug resistance protein NorM n=1 Tax=Anaerosacchariphilus polymeriproducens TaxID=1812858 RepID=A0A371AWL4_9FIRM|nr:MATE family efflux transporter [Anaerosacchariphilus polymeriproducens]RDU23976.1 MATE family efflux transporter [Anaerosacchariphilus polymeriproducens]
MNTDLTTGKTSLVLWKFSLPMLLSVLFQQLYSIADSMIAGKYAGKDALAAVGASYPVTMIFLAIATGINIGCNVIISRYYGAKEYERVKTAVYTALISSLGIAMILTGVGLLTCNRVLKLMNTPENILIDSATYLKIYILGMLFLCLYNICTGIFTALGDSKTPLCLLMFSSLGNVGLSIFFVVKFRWGVAGIGWATFIAQGIFCIIAFIVLLFRIKDIKTTGYFQYFSFGTLRQISLIAIPSIFQQSFVSVGNLFVQGLVNSFGSDVIAGYSAAIKINTFAMVGYSTLGNAISSFTSQNLGAKKHERVREGMKASIWMVIMISIPFVVANYFFASTFLRLFVDAKDAAEVIETGRIFLKIVSPFYIVVAIKIVFDGILRGAGAMWQFMSTTFLDLILRVILAFILSRFMGAIGIWSSWPVGWVLASSLSIFFTVTGAWEKGAFCTNIKNKGKETPLN